MSDFQSETLHVARVSHRCAHCRCAIPAGSQYIKIAGRWQGDFYSGKAHHDCRNLWNELYADWSDPWGGMPWDIPELFSESGDVGGVQAELDARRGFVPHAVTRIELRLRWFLGERTP
jgi:hypothetical protein